ncbi:MAG: pilin [Candidatus Saccharimonas sp.]
MKAKIKNTILAAFATATLALGMTMPVFAADLSISEGANSAKGTDQSSCLFSSQDGCDGQTPIFQTITNVLLFIIGAVSVVMLIIGGIRYTISQGDSTAITGAKNTILYSIVGLVVAILAYAAVNFVIGNFVPKADSTGSTGVSLG